MAVGVVLLLTAVRADVADDHRCPEDCDCHYFRVNYVTDCSESNLTEIPYDELSSNVYILDMNGRCDFLKFLDRGKGEVVGR